VEEAGGTVDYLTEKRGVSLIAGNEVICGKIREVLFRSNPAARGGADE